MDHADEIIERLARELDAVAWGEVQFMETTGIPQRLGAPLAVAALGRAAVKLQARSDGRNTTDEIRALSPD
jgi:hypothetical protein